MSAVIDATSAMALNAQCARCIDNDDLEAWVRLFTERCLYRVTTADNHAQGMEASLIYADSRAMLGDRVLSLRTANVYEKQRYRHLVGLPVLLGDTPRGRQSETPFVVVRVMRGGETTIFATGRYLDELVIDGTDTLRLASRVVVCDSHNTDTLLAIPL
ncbi:aromatic-ring-hydroxylating dioxygenase subunit beta [Hydrogenophaga sp.]|jgi:3-phenylpropionate/cinnamic acid dioxygenase small subunit|uniref:aromatic-ring-hydroxylating dioxygenase subunit beta n=1 Tax=Hydrogenophaga sp. TaxID=1904254 RepID=UPI0025B8B01F|nr:aromatic-ring-hydroxylating dioxygenase subunit beta [Hydrogenophaga sp.]